MPPTGAYCDASVAELELPAPNRQVAAADKVGGEEFLRRHHQSLVLVARVTSSTAVCFQNWGLDAAPVALVDDAVQLWLCSGALALEALVVAAPVASIGAVVEQIPWLDAAVVVVGLHLSLADLHQSELHSVLC